MVLVKANNNAHILGLVWAWKDTLRAKETLFYSASIM